MRNPEPSTLDEVVDELLRLGWCVGDSLQDGVWVVLGGKGHNIIKATGLTRLSAWSRAFEQAITHRLAERDD